MTEAQRGCHAQKFPSAGSGRTNPLHHAAQFRTSKSCVAVHGEIAYAVAARFPIG
jgi:hypothetical protein